MNWNEIFEYRDGELYWKIRPSNKKLKYKRVGCFSHGYIRCGYRNKLYYVHRIVWEMHNGKIPEGMVIDHKDGDGLNNKLGNLHLVTHVGNKRNLPINKKNTSGVTGVYWNKQKNAWDAKICVDSININLGRYKKKDDAIKARKTAEKEYGFSKTHGIRAKRIASK